MNSKHKPYDYMLVELIVQATCTFGFQLDQSADHTDLSRTVDTVFEEIKLFLKIIILYLKLKKRAEK